MKLNRVEIEKMVESQNPFRLGSNRVNFINGAVAMYNILSKSRSDQFQKSLSFPALRNKMKFIKWKYNDHGWPDFQLLRLPDWIPEDDKDEILEYLIKNADIPTWSERYLPTRIKWEIVEKEVIEKPKVVQFREGLEKILSKYLIGADRAEFMTNDIMKLYNEVHK